jgi:glyoxylase-like metal-dependent hydrolase (beta-lactamase superfamily II)
VDGRWVPTFPNARYIMARREFEAAQAASGDAEERTYEDNVLPIVEAGRAVLVEMDHALDDEVWLDPTPGHTAGHVAIRVAFIPNGIFSMTQTLTKPVERGGLFLKTAQIVAA